MAGKIGRLEGHWIDRVVRELELRGDEQLVFSTAKTPSGPIHVGVGRELVYCSAFETLLRERGFPTAFYFFVDDFDSLKTFPPATPKDFASRREYLGRPMWAVPCPYGHCESWGRHYAQELIETFPTFGFHPQIVWSHRLYQTPEMKNLIRKALEKVGELKAILRRVVTPTLQGEKLEAFQKELEDWYPCLVVCEACGRLMTTKVQAYDSQGDLLTYSCKACGRRGQVKIADHPVKLRWRIDWPAKWALFKVSCEPAGKDHCVKGGAYDTGEHIVSRVFGWKPPYRIPYEWILLGAKAMKTHKGISFTFAEWSASAPPEVYRFMVLREEPRKHINFSPERLPQLIDEFERAEKIYFNLEKASTPEEEAAVRRVYPLSLPEGPPASPPLRLPFRFAIVLCQLTPLLGEEGVKSKVREVLEKLGGGKKVGEEVISSAQDRLKKAQYWVVHYAGEDLRFNIAETLPAQVREMLDSRQREGLKRLAEMLEEKDWDEAELQYQVFELGKSLGIGPKIFEAVYLVFLGKKFGPRLAPFLLSLDKEFAVKRLRETS
ncbi:lysine--tRNA ligase [Candidatus Hecatella orcuttiae]|uniref:lysine--tRNA ligase n=1 Tax=Candidatus Hecatella orcuttiae TaxID=1935119 RepID=UPI0028683AB1|nr:lysine--tRNA ligase [Candidatus Hecatella orcuttiae]